MKVSEKVYNVVCDCCDTLMDDEHWYPEGELETIVEDFGYKHLGDKYYCSDCWSIGEDGNIVTKDGKKFDRETYEEIKVE